MKMNSAARFAVSVFAAAMLIGLPGAGCGDTGDSRPAPRVEKGVLDLRQWNFRTDGVVSLDGDWFHLASRFADGKDFDSVSTFAPVPGKFPDGFATYHVRILLPPDSRELPLELRLPTFATAVRITADNREIWSVGRLGEKRATHASQYRTGTAHIPTLSSDVLSLTMRVSYFGSRKGGPWRGMQLGLEPDIIALDTRDIALDLFLAGSILLMSLYHLGLFLTNRRDRASMIFAILCLVCFVRLLVNSQFLIGRWWPDFPWGISHRVNYISFYVAVPLFVSFLTAVFHDPRERLLNYLNWPVLILGTLIVIFTPVYVYPLTLTAFQLYTLPWILMTIVLWIRAIVRRETGARISFAAGLVLVGTAINDLVYSNAATAGVDLMFPGLFIFILGQSYVLAVTISRVFTSRRLLSNELEQKAAELAETNRAIARFVPMTFFEQLGKTDVRQINLGDQTQAEMQLLFSDIRSFTELSEDMSPRENFEFLNSYLRRVTPLILNHDGFIEKYIGDAILALFPAMSENTLEAAVGMQREIREFNRHRLRKGYVPIQAGIGLHAGSLMLGTIGARDRMDGTVISAAVDVVQRIEALTKTFGAGILASDAVMRATRKPGDYLSRMVGKLGHADHGDDIRIHEVFNGRPDEVIELFTATKNDFERGIQAFESQRWKEGADAMKTVLARDPGDIAAKHYLDKLTARGLDS